MSANATAKRPFERGRANTQRVESVAVATNDHDMTASAATLPKRALGAWRNPRKAAPATASAKSMKKLGSA